MAADQQHPLLSGKQFVKGVLCVHLRQGNVGSENDLLLLRCCGENCREPFFLALRQSRLVIHTPPCPDIVHQDETNAVPDEGSIDIS